jgi:hypothetical protein
MASILTSQATEIKKLAGFHGGRALPEGEATAYDPCMDWQHVITIMIVALAAAYVLRRAVSRFAGKQAGSCSGCHSCPAAKPFDAVPERPFISADQLGLFSDAEHPLKR